MSHATTTHAAVPAESPGFRVVYHPPLCPDCGSTDVVTEEVETGDDITETALICGACGTAWPVACVCDWTPTPSAARAARTAVAR
ncbi:MAG: hypothetical protein ACR2FU_02120 [Streptosporangiaceae bacterium]